MSTPFNQRVFGCAIIKSLNSTYNADFSHQPRTLPNGTAYATDKALKYAIRNYWDKMTAEKVFYFKSLKDDLQPRNLDERYEQFFGKLPAKGKDVRLTILQGLLSCLDVRLFGGTFASKSGNISIHGSCQISHGVNRFEESIIYSEQIMSPFKNSSDKSKDSTMTTLGTQSKLQEGHFVHHFSVNPKSIANHAQSAKTKGLLQSDIVQLKEALKKGVTYYDSAAKSGTENELLLWVELKEGAKTVLPSFVQLIHIEADGSINLEQVSQLLKQDNVAQDIAKIEIAYQKGITKVKNAPEAVYTNL